MDNKLNFPSSGDAPSSRGLPAHDYVSPNLNVIIPDAAFPNIRVGDTRIPQWTWLRKWVPHNWYIDKALPYAGFASRDEVAIIYNTALKFRGRPCLEVGCWRGWSTVHFARGSGSLHVIDPILGDPEFAASIRASCAAAGVLDKIEFHEGYSPGAIDELSQRLGIKWSLIFIDAEHEGDAPRQDAEAALRNAADDAVILFHDLTSPFVAAALHRMRDAGWRTMLYQTMQIMGVAWRGNVEPVRHFPDPNVFWTLPKHLAGYEVSNWEPPRPPHEGQAWWPSMTIEDRYSVAMLLAQSKEDKLVSEILDHEKTRSELNSTGTRLSEAQQRLERLSSVLSSTERRAQELDAGQRAILAQYRILLNQLIEERIVSSELHAQLRAQQKSATVELAEQARHFAMRNQERSRRFASQQALIMELSSQAATLRVVFGLLRRSAAKRRSILLGWAETVGLSQQGAEDLLLRFCRSRAIFGLMRRSYRARQALLALGLIQAAAIQDNGEAKPAARLHLITLPAAWHLLARGAELRRLGDLQAYFEGLDLADEYVLARVKLTRFDPPYEDNQDALHDSLAAIRASTLLDPSFYRRAAGIEGKNIDAAVHYLLLGEVLGFRPSEHFDPLYYAQQNTDVLAGGTCLLAHYINHGVIEGRAPHAPDVIHKGAAEWDETKENVIVVSHEASRTGAPILAWNIAKALAHRYNVFIVLLGGGALVSDFYAICTHVCGPFPRRQSSSVDFRFSLANIFAQHKFKYAIVNSTESRAVIETCANHLTPTLFLVHEFGTYVLPRAELTRAFDLADEIIFPAPLVAQSSESIYPPLRDRAVRILPQGMSELPPVLESKESGRTGTDELEALRKRKKQGAFVILGAGTVSVRKGVDLFISVAAAALQKRDAPLMHFVWIGHGYRPLEDMNYSIYLQEQIDRAGLTDHVTFLNETPDLDAVYALADAFLLTSRLDPLPNVSIDSAWKGIPIVCFENASGMADLLAQDSVTALGVVPHLNIEAARAALVRLAESDIIHAQVSEATATFARRSFEMERYIDQLDEIGTQHAAQARQLREAAQIIASHSGFSADFFTGAEPKIETREEAVRRYVAMWNQRARSSSWLRRPAPGFNAFAWLAGVDATRGGVGEPYAEFLAAGSPAGAWQVPVLERLSLRASEVPTRHGVTQALVHVYTDNMASFGEIFARLTPLASQDVQLLVSAPEGIRATLRQILDECRIAATLIEAELPDALSLAVFLESNISRFDYGLVAHLRATSDQVVLNWRDFHWEHVLGGRLAAAEAILAAFDRDPKLGLVYPAEPYYPVWDDALREHVSLITTGIAPRGHYDIVHDYPEGGIFWARREVMRRLAQPNAGTSHFPRLALGDAERVLPAACRAAGLNAAVVTSLGVDW